MTNHCGHMEQIYRPQSVHSFIVWAKTHAYMSFNLFTVSLSLVATQLGHIETNDEASLCTNIIRVIQPAGLV